MDDATKPTDFIREHCDLSDVLFSADITDDVPGLYAMYKFKGEDQYCQAVGEHRVNYDPYDAKHMVSLDAAKAQLTEYMQKRLAKLTRLAKMYSEILAAGEDNYTINDIVT